MTFLFTDVEGSTKLWDTHRAVMGAALRSHDEALRAAIEEQHGVVFKTIGDAFCAAFQSPADALQTAIATQRTLAARDWGEIGSLRVRAALHTGEAEERDADYFGPTVNRVARLLAAGHGGQVLLSQAAVDALGTLADGAELRDLGERRLKDLTAPERIYQLLAPGLDADFPPLETLDARPNNLPAQPTPLLGRETELETVKSRLRQPATRILTLTGPGGTGKTRLALQVGADLIDDFPHGVWFVDLSAVTDPDLVPAEIANALGVREEGGDPIAQQLRAYLRDKELLLVLDNLEHLLAAGKAIAALRAESPGVKLLVTSRAPLRISGEQEYAVPPLGVPDPTRRLPNPDQLLAYPAVELFVQRANAVKHAFALTADNAPAVARICADLDGLPLAIELAAARVRLLPPQALLAKLEHRLTLLTGGARDRAARQQTLRNTIAWSHDLLPEPERVLFARLSVFAGGGTFEAAEAVCNRDGELDLFEGLEQLVQHSLVRQEETADGEPRFRMLATIRAFASEQLDERGEDETIRRTHAACFLAFAEGGRPALTGPDQAAWLDRLQTEHDNLRLALDAFAATGDGVSELRLADALWGFWYLRGHLTEAAIRLERALANGAGAPEATRASALDGAGMIADLRGEDGRAEDLFRRALALFRSIGDAAGAASALDNLGVVSQQRGEDTEAAAALFEQALALRRAAADAHGVALSLTNLANHALLRRDFDRAIAHGEECVALCRDLDNPYLEALALGNLAEALRVRGELPRAVAVYGAALTLLRGLGHQGGIADSLDGMAAVAIATGHTEQGVMLFGAVDALRQETGMLSDSVTSASLADARDVARARLGEIRFQASRNAGAQLGALRAIDLALGTIASLSAARLPA